jgi:UDP-glucose 4-epimerase
VTVERQSLLKELTLNDMAWRGRRVLVTGGGGFVGSHLVRLLVSSGSDVVSLGRNLDPAEKTHGAQYLSGAISLDTLQSIPFVPATVFHLAGGSSVAASISDPLTDFLKTVFSADQLFDYARRHWPQAQLVYVSSAAVYGKVLPKVARHDLAYSPISPYGVHKRYVELLLLDHARLYQTKSVIVRPFSIYGPGQRKLLLWDAMQKADRGDFEFFGSGSELRDFVYISDLVKSLLLLSQNASTVVPVFNAGTCHAVSVREVLSELYSVAGLAHAPKFLGHNKEGDPDSLVADGSAEELLGPLFQTSLSEGLTAYVNWYRHRGKHD